MPTSNFPLKPVLIAGLVTIGAVLLLRALKSDPPAPAGNPTGSSNSSSVASKEDERSTAWRNDNPQAHATRSGSPQNARRTNREIAPPAKSEAHAPNYPDEAKDAIALTWEPEQTFLDAEEEFGVPAAILKAVAQIESTGEHNEGYPNDRGGRGLMGLRQAGEQPMIERAAQLLAVPDRSVIVDPVQNIRAAAALLRYYRSQAPSGEQTWGQALARYSGQSETEALEYIGQIRQLLDEGIQATGGQGSHLSIPPGQGNLLEDAP